jgi:hypothetical protein
MLHVEANSLMFVSKTWILSLLKGGVISVSLSNTENDMRVLSQSCYLGVFEKYTKLVSLLKNCYQPVRRHHGVFVNASPLYIVTTHP